MRKALYSLGFAIQGTTNLDLGRSNYNPSIKKITLVTDWEIS
jgi:hypothetical protein